MLTRNENQTSLVALRGESGRERRDEDEGREGAGPLGYLNLSK
jgi:hypothetical protein